MGKEPETLTHQKEKEILQHEKEKPVESEDRSSHAADAGGRHRHCQREAVGTICRLPGRGVRESNVFSQRQDWL